MDKFERNRSEHSASSNLNNLDTLKDKVRKRAAQGAATIIGLTLASGAATACEPASAHETTYPTATQTEQGVEVSPSPSEQLNPWDTEYMLKDVNLEDYEIKALDSYTQENAMVLAQQIVDRDIEKFEKFFVTDEASHAMGEFLDYIRENGEENLTPEQDAESWDAELFYDNRVKALADKISSAYYASSRTDEDIQLDRDGLLGTMLREAGGHAFIAQAFEVRDLGEYYVDVTLLDSTLSLDDTGVITLVFTVRYDSNISLGAPELKDEKTERSTYRLVEEDGLLKVLSVSTEFNV